MAQEWVEKHGAGSSELSDSQADHFGLQREAFRHGRPANWGEHTIEIAGWGQVSRVAPVHERTQLPLGEGCRWERRTLDHLSFPVYAFFVP